MAIYKLLAGLLNVFRQFYATPDNVTITVVQHFCKNIDYKRETDAKGPFTEFIKHLSAARHLCVVIPDDVTDQ